MKKIVLGLIVVLGLIAVITLATTRSETFILIVRDQNGVPVENAKVVVKQLAKIQPLDFWAELNYDTHTARTDKNGRAVVNFKVNHKRFDWTVEADGYYSTPNEKHEAFKIDDNEEDDSITLLEHEITRETTLYKKINPQPMIGYAAISGINLPSPIGRFGFDLELQDWIAPYGKGKTVDFYVVMNVTTNGDEVVYGGGFEFENGAGVYRAKQTGSDAFPSTYHADMKANYQSSISFMRKYRIQGKNKEVLITYPVATDGEYLVMRTRVKCDDQGNRVSANYSKMIGKVYLGESWIFKEVVFNPRSNDCNLEFDGERNLGSFRGVLAP